MLLWGRHGRPRKVILFLFDRRDCIEESSSGRSVMQDEALHHFLLTEHWNFRQTRGCAKFVRCLRRVPGPLPAGLNRERKARSHNQNHVYENPIRKSLYLF
jgi:hypothetical protein